VVGLEHHGRQETLVALRVPVPFSRGVWIAVLTTFLTSSSDVTVPALRVGCATVGARVLHVTSRSGAVDSDGCTVER